MSDRANLEEVLKFANEVREAGGGNPIDVLMPGIPEKPNQCLIANNLNFNCRVNGWASYAVPDEINFEELGYEEGEDVWYMSTTSDIALAISNKLSLPRVDYNHNTSRVVLPAKIGRVATAFDTWKLSKISKKLGKLGGGDPEFESLLESHFKSEVKQILNYRDSD